MLRGDELRSLMESSPQLLRYIAAELEINGKVGVAFGQLRSLGEQGLLTTNRLMDALMAAQPAIEADFINAPRTAQQSWVIMGDTITRTIGQISQRSYRLAIAERLAAALVRPGRATENLWSQSSDAGGELVHLFGKRAHGLPHQLS